METISRSPFAPAQLPVDSPVRSLPGAPSHVTGRERPTADDVREKFTAFVGETFYGQLIKSMRTSLGKPAYFHGGRGEEVFQSQLDQQFAQHMTKASADTFAEPMFRQQFPQLAARDSSGDPAPLSQLNALSRR